MDGASGAFAVISLAIQLFQIVQETSKFVKDIRDVSSELTRLCETLDQLGSVLGYVKQLLEQQMLVLRLPGSPLFIVEALRNCERGLKPLIEVVNKAKEASNDYRAKRMWRSLRFVMKKEQLQDLQSQLRDAKSDLQFAVSANSWQLQMHHLDILREVGPRKIGTVEKKPPDDMPKNVFVSRVEASLDACTVRSKKPSSITVEQTDRTWYNGILGSVRVHRKLKRGDTSSTNRQSQTGIAIEEDLFMINPSFMRQSFELRFCNSFGRIARSLNIYPVMMEDDPIFKMCQRGDKDGMEVAFSGGNMSPFVLDNCGRTLLHHAAMYFHSDICSWLIEFGVNPDTWSASKQTALQRVAIPGVSNEYGGDLTSFATPIVDTLRVLSQAQTDFSQADIKEFLWLYSGPPSGVEFFLLHNTNLAGTPDKADKELSAFAFAVAVSLFGKCSMQWESVIRKLIHEEVDIHGQVRRLRSEPWYHDGPLPTPRVLGTPLDELFGHTKTPFEARTVGNSWLRILASEGFDILAYLEEEIALHTAQHLSTWATYLHRRVLIFQLGENPGVWWDWQLEPESGAILVREAYKSLNLTNEEDNLANYYRTYTNDTPQQDTWPWGYPDWFWAPWYSATMPESEQNNPMLVVDRRRHLAYDRATRRMEKKASKKRRALGMKNASKMPGAWPL